MKIQNDTGEVRSRIRKLQPTCRLPVSSVMRRLTPDQTADLTRLTTDVLECVIDPSFKTVSAEARFTAALPPNPGRRLPDLDLDENRSDRRKRNLPRGLTRSEEQTYFLRFNYGRFRLMKVLREFRGKRLTLTAARELLKWDQFARDTRDVIVQSNLGLVPTMIERSRITGVDFTELISEGQLALLRSVSKFDCSRGFKFSTYACRAILSSISRSVALTVRHRNYFPTEFDPDLQKSDELERRRAEVEDDFVNELNSILTANLAQLTEAEKRVLRERFGVKSASDQPAPRPKTLRQVAALFGVTKERVRQIQNKAMEKIRLTLEAGFLGNRPEEEAPAAPEEGDEGANGETLETPVGAE